MNEPLQGTDEWKALRCGKVTASRIGDLTAKIKSGAWSATRANYMAELIAERLTGIPADVYVSPAMAWGSAKEPDARANYEFYTDATIVPASFVHHPDILMSGASPDGYIGDDGLVEFKCPMLATHIATLLGAPIDPDYIKQIHWQFACCRERTWCHWVSYHPALPAEMQMVIRPVKRDLALVSELECATVVFLEEVNDKVAALKALYERKAA